MRGGRSRNAAERLRMAVEALPRRSREAMLRGIRENRIIVGAYADKPSGGICPMLAAHRNGGRTNLASFARAWDRFTGAKRPRPATKREIRALTAHLEMSLSQEEAEPISVARLAERIRAERHQLSRAAGETASIDTRRTERTRRATGERHRGRELRRRRLWSWLVPTRRLDVYEHRVAAAQEQLAEQRAGEALRKSQRVP